MNTKIYHLVEGVTPNSKAHSSLLLGLPKLTSEGMSSAEPRHKLRRKYTPEIKHTFGFQTPCE